MSLTNEKEITSVLTFQDCSGLKTAGVNILGQHQRNDSHQANHSNDHTSHSRTHTFLHTRQAFNPPTTGQVCAHSCNKSYVYQYTSKEEMRKYNRQRVRTRDAGHALRTSFPFKNVTKHVNFDNTK